MGLIIEPDDFQGARRARLALRRLSGAATWLPVALLLTGVGWGSNQIAPLLVVYQRTLSLPTGMVEAMFGVYALGMIPGLLVAGPLSDARGRRVVAVPAAGLSLVASVTLVGGGHMLWLLFAGRLLAGVSSGAAFGVATAWVRELSRPPHGDASDHVAARRAAVAMTLGFALGPLVAGVLAQWAPQPFTVPYLPHLLLMAVVLSLVGASPETVTPGRRRVLFRQTGQYDRVRFRRVVVPMAPWVFAAPAIAFALLPSVVGAEHAPDGTAVVAAVTALCALTGVAVQPLARRLDAQARRDWAAPVGLAVLATGLALGAATTAMDRLWLLLPCAVVLGAAYGLCLVAGLVQVQRLAPADGLAQLTAVYYLVTYTGFAAPYLLALGAHLASYSTLLLITAGLALLTAGGVHLAASRQARERSPGMPTTALPATGEGIPQ
jgi:MFS family permease